MSKWSEILPQDALYLATELEAHAQEERDNGKILYPPQEQIFKALQLLTDMGGTPIDWSL